MLKMEAILMAHRMPSRHREATSGSSQSCKPTLKAASKGVHASCKTKKSIIISTNLNWWVILNKQFNNPVQINFTAVTQLLCRVQSVTLNMGLTCSRCVALKNGAWAWLTASIRALAVFAICSISMLYSRRRCFSLATPAGIKTQTFLMK